MKAFAYGSLCVAALVVLSWAVARRRAQAAFARRVKALYATAPDRSTYRYSEHALDSLPAPVQRYFRFALVDGQHHFSSVRLTHGGDFRQDLDGRWMNIRGEEHLVAGEPGFAWMGTTPLFTAVDEYAGGHGSLTVRLLGALRIVRSTGQETSEAELQRWLGECVWMPTALLPTSQLHWTPHDDRSAWLHYQTDSSKTISYLVHFDAAGGIARMETARYNTDGKRGEWVGLVKKYTRVDGVMVPMYLEAGWTIGGELKSYARFEVTSIQLQ